MKPSRRRPAVIVSFVIASLFVLGCSGSKDDSHTKEDVSKPADTKPTATSSAAKGVEPSKTAEPAKTADPAKSATPADATPASSKYRKLTSDEIAERVKQIGKGHTIHPEHSFAVTLKGFTGSVLASTGPGSHTFVFHLYDAAGKRVTSVFDKDKNDWEGSKILALAFEDVDHDSNEDLVVVAAYSKPGENGVSVYNRAGGGPFVFSAPLSKKGGKAGTMQAALAALK